MKFLDQAKIYIGSGAGGNGCIGFRREKFIEFGGPNGGDGGKGGNVWIECVDNLNTLIDYRYQQHFKAKTGQGGMGQNRSGANGDDCTIKVPPGTEIFAEDGETLLGDLTVPGQRLLLAKGGNGGFGNAHFKSATNRAPTHANPGLPGEELTIWLRLKLIADAGLVGLPNAGKSTFLAAVSAAKPKIADYPFTTLHPNLGVVRTGDTEFVLADIPGLIEGAHEGAGLGDQFLGHVERCRVLLHLVDATEADVAAAYKTVRRELKAYHSIITALARGDWSRIVLFDSVAQPELSRRSIREISDARGVEPLDAIYDILLAELEAPREGGAEPASVRSAGRSANLHRLMIVAFAYREEDIRIAFEHPLCMVGSDATALAPDGPLAGTSFHGAYTWAGWYYRHFVRETRMFKPEDAIRRMTSLPAQRLGLKDRGLIQKGARGDLAIFDPAKFAERGTTFEPNQTATGMHHVLVNGVFARRDGALTGQRTGHVLRHLPGTG